jgi:hypothetical protein
MENLQGLTPECGRSFDFLAASPSKHSLIFENQKSARFNAIRSPLQHRTTFVSSKLRDWHASKKSAE